MDKLAEIPIRVRKGIGLDEAQKLVKEVYLTTLGLRDQLAAREVALEA
jgi:hypothetical protein